MHGRVRHGRSLRRLAAHLLDTLVFAFELQLVNLLAPQKRRVARFGDAHFAQHLAHDDFDVLVVDLHTLQPIYLLNFIDEVLLQILRSADFENFMRNDGTLSKLLTLLYEIALEHDNVFGKRDQVFFLGSGVGILQNQASLSADGAAHLNNAVDLGNLRCIFWPARFE